MILKQLNFIKLSVRQRQQVNLTCIYACPMKGRIYIYTLKFPRGCHGQSVRIPALVAILIIRGRGSVTTDLCYLCMDLEGYIYIYI
jgi:hypothetical protein